MNFATLKSLTIPEGVVKKIEAGGKVLWELATPDTPTAALYIYGTPNESGNIGLRVGDTVTYYDGAVFSNIDEVYTDALKQTHPYAGIMTSNGNCMLIVANAKAKQLTGFLPSCTWDTNDGNCAFVSWVYSELSGWEFSTSSEHGSPIAGSSNWMWANHDIYQSNGKLYIAQFAPIPVSGIVGNSYNGNVLPELPESDLPYAAIVEVNGSYRLYFRDAELGTETGNVTIGSYGAMYEAVNGEWVAGNKIATTKPLVWANHDVANSNGDVIFAASEPIIVYE